MDKLPPTLRLAASAVVVAGAVAAGYGLGSKFGGSPNAAIGGAVALGVAGGAAAYAMNAVAPHVAAVNLHNYVAGLDHPSVFKKEDIDGIANRFLFFFISVDFYNSLYYLVGNYGFRDCFGPVLVNYQMTTIIY